MGLDICTAPLSGMDFFCVLEIELTHFPNSDHSAYIKDVASANASPQVRLMPSRIFCLVQWSESSADASLRPCSSPFYSARWRREATRCVRFLARIT